MKPVTLAVQFKKATVVDLGRTQETRPPTSYEMTAWTNAMTSRIHKAGGFSSKPRERQFAAEPHIEIIVLTPSHLRAALLQQLQNPVRAKSNTLLPLLKAERL